jgi:hypothetical protein
MTPAETAAVEAIRQHLAGFGANLREAEFVTYLDAVAPDEAAALRELQHDAGFRANVAGTEFQEFRPAAWQAGWLTAYELGAFAPLAFFRMERE